MKTEKLEKLLLLEQSGELSVRQRKQLEACPEAVVKRKEIKALCTAVCPSGAEASPWGAVRIDARLRAERRSLLLPARVWKPVLALAACLTLLVSIWNFGPESSSAPPVTVQAVKSADVWNVRFEEDLAELESLIVAISGDPLSITEM